MMSSPYLDLGEYLLMYAIVGLAIFAVLGFIFGTGAGGAFLFFLGGVAIIIAAYIILARIYRFLLHGSFSASSDSGNGGEI